MSFRFFSVAFLDRRSESLVLYAKMSSAADLPQPFACLSHRLVSSVKNNVGRGLNIALVNGKRHSFDLLIFMNDVLRAC